MARKTKEEAEKTYHALLDAASELFLRQGVARTTLTNIAEAANMTRGAVYWHFDDKDAVIKALWQRNADAGHNAFVERLHHISDEDPVTEFRGMICEIVQTVVHDPNLAQVLRIVIHNVEFTDEESDLQRFLLEKKAILFDAMVQAFRQLSCYRVLKVDLSAELLANSLIAYIHGLMEIYLKPGLHKLDLEQHSDTLLSLYLDAVLKSN